MGRFKSSLHFNVHACLQRSAADTRFPFRREEKSRTRTENLTTEHGVSPPYPLQNRRPPPEKPSPQPSPTGKGVSGCCATVCRITHKKQPALSLSLTDLKERWMVGLDCCPPFNANMGGCRLLFGYCKQPALFAGCIHCNIRAESCAFHSANPVHLRKLMCRLLSNMPKAACTFLFI